jgi:hypothetical protein
LLLVLLVVMVGAVIAFQASRAYGGPLDPPGPVGSTDGVREAGTPISSLPFTITQPGYYYVTRDLTGVIGQSGIVIAANDVTLDLHGFTLRGVAGSVSGVSVSGARSAIVIRDGIIRDWFNGIDAQNASYARISEVTVLSSGDAAGDGSYGVIVSNYSTLEDCNVSGSASNGVYALKSVVRGCVVTASGLNGVIAAGGDFLQNNRINGNTPGVGSAPPYDTDLSGQGTYASENQLGRVRNSITPTDSVAGMRNVFCGGLAGPGDVKFDTDGEAEYNDIQSCGP